MIVCVTRMARYSFHLDCSISDRRNILLIYFRMTVLSNRFIYPLPSLFALQAYTLLNRCHFSPFIFTECIFATYRIPLYSDVFVAFSTSRMSLEDMKKSIWRNLKVLEAQGLVSSKNDYQDIVNAIAKVFTTTG